MVDPSEKVMLWMCLTFFACFFSSDLIFVMYRNSCEFRPLEKVLFNSWNGPSFEEKCDVVWFMLLCRWAENGCFWINTRFSEGNVPCRWDERGDRKWILGSSYFDFLFFWTELWFTSFFCLIIMVWYWLRMFWVVYFGSVIFTNYKSPNLFWVMVSISGLSSPGLYTLDIV
jgi:hypothetical protein